MTSLIEESHNDPIYKVQWLQSKTGQEFASISSDGTVKWWDMKNMSKPMETMVIMNKLDGTKMGGTAMDYDPSLGVCYIHLSAFMSVIILSLSLSHFSLLPPHISTLTSSRPNS